jgi:hypothetical protein
LEKNGNSISSLDPCNTDLCKETTGMGGNAILIRQQEMPFNERWKTHDKKNAAENQDCSVIYYHLNKTGNVLQV